MPATGFYIGFTFAEASSSGLLAPHWQSQPYFCCLERRAYCWLSVALAYFGCSQRAALWEGPEDWLHSTPRHFTYSARIALKVVEALAWPYWLDKIQPYSSHWWMAEHSRWPFAKCAGMCGFHGSEPRSSAAHSTLPIPSSRATLSCSFEVTWLWAKPKHLFPSLTSSSYLRLWPRMRFTL